MTDFRVRIIVQRVRLIVQRVRLIVQKVRIIVQNSRGKCNGIISLIGLISLVILIRPIDEIKIEGCFHSFLDSFKHPLKDNPKQRKTFQLWKKTQSNPSTYLA